MTADLAPAAEQERAAYPVNLGYTLMTASAAALGGLMFGFDIAIITGAGPFIQEAFDLDALGFGWAFSSLLFGCIFGAAIAGAIVDRIGRKALMLLVAVLFALTTLATGAAGSFDQFITARFLGGLAVGAASLVVPMYVSEITPAPLRGRMGALYQMAIVTGILGSYLVNYLLRDTGPDAWRYMFYTGVIPALIYLAVLLLVPESPRFLIRQGKEAAARRVLERIGGAGTEAALEAVRASLRVDSGTWRDLAGAHVRAPLRLSFFLAILIHLSGINTIIEYAPTIFRSAGFTLDAALFSTFVVGIANFAFTLVSFQVIDRFGRRPLYIIGSAGMMISLICLAGAAVTGNFHGMMVLVLIVLYLFFFASCIGPVFWTLLPEIFPNGLRGKAMTVPVLTQWGANALVVLFFPAIFHALGEAVTFLLLAGACLAQLLFVIRALPETRNRTLEEISAAWADERRAPG